MDELIGKHLGPYQIASLLGNGGMADVYKAYHAKMDRHIALKVLSQQLSRRPEFVQRFQNEAGVVAKLQHSHIVQVFDHGQSDGFFYLAMPLLDGGTLQDEMKRSRPSIGRVRTIAQAIGSALDYAHERGVIHRDIKPANILLDSSGNCYLTDFGIARLTDIRRGLTSANVALGTGAYMSPEQHRGERVDARSDIYSFGVMLYQLLTGQLPLTSDTEFGWGYQHVHTPPKPLTSISPQVPEEMATAVMRALSKDPNSRQQRAQQLVRDMLETSPGDVFPATVRRASTQGAVTRTAAGPPTAFGTAMQGLFTPARLISGAGLLVLLILAGVVITGIVNPPSDPDVPTAAAGASVDRVGKDGSGEPVRIDSQPTKSPPLTRKPDSTKLPDPTATLIAVVNTESETEAVESLKLGPTTTLAPTVLDVQPTDTATPEPTITLKPEDTPAPTRVPTRTPQATRLAPNSLTPRAQTASAPSQSYAVLLLQPGEQFGFDQNTIPVFSWSSNPLGPSDYFKLEIAHREGVDVICTRQSAARGRDYIAALNPTRWRVVVVRVDTPVADGAACSGTVLAATAYRGLRGQVTQNPDLPNSPENPQPQPQPAPVLRDPPPSTPPQVP